MVECVTRLDERISGREAAPPNRHVAGHHRVTVSGAHGTKVLCAVVQHKHIVTVLALEAGQTLFKVVVEPQAGHLVRMEVVAEVSLSRGHQ